jgi:hypothetical protein
LSDRADAPLAPEDPAAHVPARPDPPPRPRTTGDGRPLVWWRELLLAVIVYVIYETVRNLSAGGRQAAFDNAMRVIDWQRAVGMYHELAVQEWFLRWTPVIVASNYFYGTAYIGATVATLLWLYHRAPGSYRRWRNTLAFGTLLGLIGFATFPLMPPRLLDQLGDGRHFGFVDTLISYPTLWSFDSSAVQAVSNQYAAMPSLHCGWAFWAAAALLPRLRTWVMRVVVLLYPVATVFVVVVTGNHYVLDAVGGAIVFGLGYGLARAVEALPRRGRRNSPATAAR